MGAARTIARRTFLVGSVALAGGAAFGVHTIKKPYPNPLLDTLEDGEFTLTNYVLINQDGVTLITPKGEMGQGVQSTWAALIAEELDVAWDDVKIAHGPPGKAYYNAAVIEEGLPISSLDHSGQANFMREKIAPIAAKVMAMQVTGGSSAAADGFVKLRVAGATAREMLKNAAAKKLGLKASQFMTVNGKVITPDREEIPYGDLAADAAALKMPKNISLRPPSEWKYLGKSMPRLDMKTKVTGTANFAPDLRFEGMKFGTVKMNPHLGGALKSYNADKALAMKGVDKVIATDHGVIIIADNTWTAFKAANLIDCDWGKADYPDTMAEHYAAVGAAFDNASYDSRNRDIGNVDTALEGAEVLSAEYKVPYLAHACMEPVNATAMYQDGRLDVWAGNQAPGDLKAHAMEVSGLSQDQVHIHTQFMGGGFGRKSEVDFSEYAVRAAMAMKDTPVQIMWSREEDMTHDYYRPIAMGRFRGSVKDGNIHAFDLNVACPSILESGAERGGPDLPGGDITNAMTIWDQPYAIPNYRTTAWRARKLLPVGAWRSVGGTQNAFFQESMIDEMAHAAGRDPMDFRLEMMNNDVCKTVLETVKDMSGWDRQRPEGHALGCAFVLGFAVPTAEVIEIKQTNDGIKIINAWAAVDVGTALDPRNIEAQVFGGLNFGLAAAIMGEIDVKDGKINQTNFHDYDSLRLYQAPKVEVEILENGKHIRGIGEPGTPPAAPALANAIFALTGERYRELPLNKFVAFA